MNRQGFPAPRTRRRRYNQDPLMERAMTMTIKANEIVRAVRTLYETPITNTT